MPNSKKNVSFFRCTENTSLIAKYDERELRTSVHIYFIHLFKRDEFEYWNKFDLSY